MLYLILTVVLNAYLLVAFKVFEHYKVDNLQAIVANYWVCVLTGSIFIGRFPLGAESLQQPWFYWSMLMGAAFISIFNLIAYCTREDGVTTTTIANKLSMVIPVAFAVWLYSDKLSVTKGLGILLAVPAVYLSSRTKDESEKRRNLWLAALLFIASGLLDTLVTYIARQYFSTGTAEADERGQSIYLVHAFSAAAIIGTAIVATLLVQGKRPFAWKNIIAGIALGVPNFFSIYFLLRLLQTGFLPGSAAIPVNNIGIVLLASMTAIFFFKEKAGAARIMGMILSVAAIFLIMFSDLHGNTP
jgi:drug/metabolite transporter (DMT)-like permease